MPISYRKLFELMEKKGIKKADLRKMWFSPTIIDRLVKNHNVNTSTIIKLAEILQCQPGDIMECVDSDGFTHLVPTMKGARKLQEIEESQGAKREE